MKTKFKVTIITEFAKVEKLCADKTVAMKFLSDMSEGRKLQSYKIEQVTEQEEKQFPIGYQ